MKTHSFYNKLKNNKLKLTTALLFAVLAFTNLQAQEARDSVRHRFTRLKLEMRASFDVQHEFAGQNAAGLSDTTHYGFHGQYFNLLLGGEFGKGFSYYFRQRIIANAGASSFFDNTDFLYLQYQINDNWAIRAGKEAIANGGFEYDAAPIDVYYAGDYWNNYYCFQLAGSVKFTDKSKRHHLTLQVANSPYVHYMGKGNEWKQGLMAYSLLWSGDFGVFKTLYSVNFFERQRGKFVGCVTLGNRFEVGRWSWYIDYMNRVSRTDALFSSFSVISRMDVRLGDVNIFAKGGYEQNMSDHPLVQPVRDCFVAPGQRSAFYGLGVEYHPCGSPAVRLHALLYQIHYFPEYECVADGRRLTAQVGLTWNIDFLRYFGKRLNSDNL